MLHKLNAVACALLLVVGAASTQTVKLYSARHYATDEALHDNFTKGASSKVKRVDSDHAGILACLKAEGTVANLARDPKDVSPSNPALRP